MRPMHLILLVVLLVPFSSYAQQTGHEQHTDDKPKIEHLNNTDSGTIWTCAMHPQIKLSAPGKCPICHMDLIPVEIDKSADGGIAQLKLSKTAQKLMEIAVSPVERKWVERPVRLVGKIDYDETRLKHITAWVQGRIDRLYVDYTGIEVKEGDHMVYLYSPELLSAQEELIQATRSLSRLSSGSNSTVKRSTQRSVESARGKLRLLGLTEAQVKRIQKKKRAKEHVTIHAPMGGVVVEKHINEGMYINTGTKIYTIADLSHLWMYLDAYESDLPWIRYGQAVEFTARALPGESFSGVVSFVQPFLDEKTRTVKVRVNVNNPYAKLKPGMFVTALIKSTIDASGEVLTQDFSGKYVCPMHPEVVREQSGTCPVCDMNLVKAESLPFVGTAHKHDVQPPLVIPISAPLITGKRAVVYVMSDEETQYQGREIVLGPRAGDYYLVKSGLNEGEMVVTNGAFKIDADLQIKGMKSMMNLQSGTPSSGHKH